MGLRDKLKRLERGADVRTVELVCPECGAEFKAKGEDPLLDYLAHEWVVEAKKRGHKVYREVYRETPVDMVAIANHKHDPSLMINKATGKPWLGEILAGTVRIPDDVPDHSE